MNEQKKYLDKEGLTVLVGKILDKADKTDLTAKADKSEMSVVAGTGNNIDKTTITLKSGTSATVLTSHQDISGKANVSDLSTVATSGSYNDLSNKPTIPTVPTNVSSFTNDANYVTQDTLDDILGVDVNGLAQIKEVLSDDDTTTGLINLIGLKVNVEDVLSITDTEINRLFNPALFLRVSSELQGTSIVVNEIGKIVKFNEGVNQWILTYTMDGFRPDTVSLYSSSSSNFGQVTTPIEVTTSNEGAIWLFQYNNVNYTLNRNNLSVSPSITLF